MEDLLLFMLFLSAICIAVAVYLLKKKKKAPQSILSSQKGSIFGQKSGLPEKERIEPSVTLVEVQKNTTPSVKEETIGVIEAHQSGASEKAPASIKSAVSSGGLDVTVANPQTVAKRSQEPNNTDLCAASASLEDEGKDIIRINPVAQTLAYIDFGNNTARGADVVNDISWLKSTLNFPIRYYARSVKDEKWYPVTSDKSYDAVACVLQLAKKNWSLDDISASLFISQLTQFAIRFESDASTEEASAIVERARKLAQWIRDYDLSLSFTLQTPGIIPARDFERAASLAGFKETGRTRWVYRPDPVTGDSIVSITRDDKSLGSITLSLDVPCAKTSDKPLELLFSLANDLCARLKLILTDGNGRELPTAAVHQIQHQLKDYYASMEKAGLEPGSEVVWEVLRK